MQYLMKTKFTLYSLAIFFSLSVSAQQSIDINNLNALFNPDGVIAYNGTEAAFEIPKGSDIQSVFSANLWIGAKDVNDNLYMAANRYQQTGSDFFAGPLATTYNAAYDAKYNRIWKVDKAAIDAHIANYLNLGYMTPASIAEWPGNGNTANGEAGILAPFEDLNANGLYEPALGDYPSIKGDQALFIMYNDARSAHGESGGSSMGVEVHLMVYAYDAANPVLDNTVFMHYTVINRSAMNYKDMVLGFWNDFDLGNFANDRVGSDSIKNCYYSYNGTPYDPDAAGVKGYDSVRPFMGVAFLNRQMEVFSYFTNGAPLAYTDPTTPSQYYNYMTGFWNDSSAFTYGGTGQGGFTPTKYIFNGNPCDPIAWSENTSGLQAGDRRALGATGKQNLNSGDYTCFDLAYVYYESPVGIGCVNAGHFDGFTQRVTQVRNYYNSSAQLNCEAVVHPTGISNVNNEIGLSVFPIPATNELNITTDINSLQTTMRLLDVTGKVVIVKQLNTPGRLTTALDVSNLSSGVYILNIRAAGINKSVKVNIQH